ncbi:hypothetical protein PAPHI01_0320 [Pancytospora philotis]|nr:hypothetical protein PAPHI01_0320 [Pancytospora philotis]
MRLAALHQLLIVGIAATARKRKAGPGSARKDFKDIDPFVGAIDTYLLFRDNLVKRMYQRCTTAVANQSRGARKPDAKGRVCLTKGSLVNVFYSIFATVLIHDDPVQFIHDFVKSQITEYRMLELIFEKLELHELESVIDSLVLALNSPQRDKIRSIYRSKRDAIMQALETKVTGVLRQSAHDFLGAAKDNLVSEDLLTYFSLRCRYSKCTVPDTLDAILKAIRREVDEKGHSERKCISMAYFLHNIIASKYGRADFDLSTQALNYITSSYSKNLIEMLTQQHTMQGLSHESQNSLKVCAMVEIIEYTCGKTTGREANLVKGESLSRGDPHFVRAYLEAQRKYKLISEAEEAEHLYTYYCNSSRLNRDKLLAIVDSTLDLLPAGFWQHIRFAVFPQIRGFAPEPATLKRDAYDLNLYLNDGRIIPLPLGVSCVDLQALARTIGTGQGVANKPSTVTHESP